MGRAISGPGDKVPVSAAPSIIAGAESSEGGAGAIASEPWLGCAASAGGRRCGFASFGENRPLDDFAVFGELVLELPMGPMRFRG